MPHEISQILKTPIEKDLLEAVYKNLEDEQNKLKVNNFAYAMRALLDLFLERTSPEEEVKKCSWYSPPTEEEVSRGAREVSLKKKIKYAIQGGLPDDDATVIDLEIGKEVKKLQELHRRLSGYTHINAQTFGLELSEQEEIIREIKEIVRDFTVSFIDLRQEVLDMVDVDYLDELITDSFVMDFHEDLSLMGVGYIESSEVVGHDLLNISSDHFLVSVEGHLYCEHHLGGKKDGVEIQGDYPFSVRFNVNISNKKITIEPNSFEFDTSSWYGDYEDI